MPEKIHVEKLAAASIELDIGPATSEAWRKTNELKFVKQPDGRRVLHQALAEIHSGRIEWQPVPEETLDDQTTNSIQS